MKKTAFQKGIKDYWWFWLLLSVGVGLFWFRSSCFYSDAYPNGDSAVFLTIGRGILEGKVPYVDLFDHKGPALFFVEAFTQWLHRGMFTVWLLEVLCLFLTLVLLYRTARLLVDAAPAFLTVFFYVLFMLRLFEGGNLTESYTNPFSMLALYLLVKVLTQGALEVKPRYGFALGFSFMFVFLLRATNAAVIAGATAALAVLLAARRQGMPLLRNAAAFLGGAAAVALPICIYYLANHAFADFIYGAFIHNFLYAGKGSWNEFFSSRAMVLYTLWMLLSGLAGGCVWLFGKGRGFSARFLGGSLLFITIATGYCATLSRLPYLHYLMIGGPVAALGFAMVLRRLAPLLEKRRFPVRWGAAALSIFTIALGGLWTYQISSAYCGLLPQQEQARRQALETAQRIPAEEKGSVWGYNITAEWYLHTGILPCFRYFTLQDWMSYANPEVEGEILEMLEKDPPLWIVTTNKESFGEERIQAVVLQKYRLVFSNEGEALYRLQPAL